MTVPSGSTQAGTVITSLTGIRDTARSLAADYLGLVNDADRAIAAVTWSAESGKLTQFPVLYSQQVDSARARLQAGEVNISSAQSAIQLVVSGSTSLAIQGAAVTITMPLSGAPSFRRTETETELDAKLTEIWGFEELAVRRRAAWPTLALGTPESSAQAAHTTRGLLTDLLDRFARNADVQKAIKWWTPDRDARDGVTKRDKIRYFILGKGEQAIAPSLLQELDDQVQRAFDAHDRAIKLAHHKLTDSVAAARAAIIDLEEVILTLLRYRKSL